MSKPAQPSICKILTVDDEIGIDSFFYDFFTDRHYEVYTAANGKEALETVVRERPRIVLLDITMRGMDGIEVLKKIKAFDKNITVIMVTGVADKTVEREAKTAGADEYITKPLSLEYLEKMVFLKFLDSQIKEIGQV